MHSFELFGIEHGDESVDDFAAGFDQGWELDGDSSEFGGQGGVRSSQAMPIPAPPVSSSTGSPAPPLR